MCLTPASWELWLQSQRILQRYYMDYTEVCVACVVMKSWREQHLLEVGGMLINYLEISVIIRELMIF